MELECNKCKSAEHVVKNGHHHGKQRYKCKKCNIQFTDTNEYPDKSDITKCLAVTLYLAGLPYKKVASLVKEGGTEKILRWVKERGFAARKSDPEVPREKWHKKRYSLERYLDQEGFRIKFNRRDTDVLQKIYSVTPINRFNRNFVMELNGIMEYMKQEKSKSVKRFVVIEVHRYSGEVKKVMLTP